MKNQTSKFIKNCRRKFFLVILLSLTTNLLLFTAPLFSLQVFDRVLSTRSSNTLFVLLIISIIALAVFFILDGVRNFMMLHIGECLQNGLERKLFAADLDYKPTNKRIRQTQNSLQKCRNFISSSAAISLIDAPWAPLFIAMIFFLHPTLGLCSLLGAITLFLLALLNNYLSSKSLISANKTQENANAISEEAQTYFVAAHAMGISTPLIDLWHDKQNLASKQLGKVFLANSMINSSSKFIRLTLQICLLAIGAHLVINNQLTPGGMLASTIIMGRALAPVEQLINSWRQFIEARNSWKRISESLTGSEAHETQKISTYKTPAKLTVDKVVFSYDGIKPIVQGPSFSIEAGQSIGIIGPSGSGKSTLLKLLAGGYKAQKGSVRYDGIQLTKFSDSNKAENFGFVPQDLQLFNCSIRENLCCFSEVKDQDMIDIAKQTGIHDWVVNLPQGYDTKIGKNGTHLSGGQRQSLAITRAVFNFPSVIIMDEPNSNLDSKAEINLLKTFAKLKEMGITLVVSSHKPSLLQLFDKILVMEHGQVTDYDKTPVILKKFQKAKAPRVQNAV